MPTSYTSFTPAPSPEALEYFMHKPSSLPDIEGLENNLNSIDKKLVMPKFGHMAASEDEIEAYCQKSWLGRLLYRIYDPYIQIYVEKYYINLLGEKLTSLKNFLSSEPNSNDDSFYEPSPIKTLCSTYKSIINISDLFSIDFAVTLGEAKLCSDENFPIREEISKKKAELMDKSSRDFALKVKVKVKVEEITSQLNNQISELRKTTQAAEKNTASFFKSSNSPFNKLMHNTNNAKKEVSIFTKALNTILIDIQSVIKRLDDIREKHWDTNLNTACEQSQAKCARVRESLRKEKEERKNKEQNNQNSENAKSKNSGSYQSNNSSNFYQKPETQQQSQLQLTPEEKRKQQLLAIIGITDFSKFKKESEEEQEKHFKKAHGKQYQANQNNQATLQEINNAKDELLGMDIHHKERFMATQNEPQRSFQAHPACGYDNSKSSIPQNSY